VKKTLGRRDVFTIKAAERDEIYRNEYWDPIDGNLMCAGKNCAFSILSTTE
jgi:lysozyme family protein